MGGDYPLWSLINEFWYYILFPALLILITTKNIKVRSTVLFFTLIVFILLYPSNVILYGFIWLMGVIAFQWRKLLAFPLVAFILFIIANSDSRVYYSGVFLPVDALVGLSFALLLKSIQNSSKSYLWLVWNKGFHAVQRQL